MKHQCRFGSLLACESFHADVHAGNLWLLRDGRIGFLDFGMHPSFVMSYIHGVLLAFIFSKIIIITNY